jgi:hypothetical protein
MAAPPIAVAQRSGFAFGWPDAGASNRGEHGDGALQSVHGGADLGVRRGAGRVAGDLPAFAHAARGAGRRRRPPAARAERDPGRGGDDQLRPAGPRRAGRHRRGGELPREPAGLRRDGVPVRPAGAGGEHAAPSGGIHARAACRDHLARRLRAVLPDVPPPGAAAGAGDDAGPAAARTAHLQPGDGRHQRRRAGVAGRAAADRAAGEVLAGPAPPSAGGGPPGADARRRAAAGPAAQLHPGSYRAELPGGTAVGAAGDGAHPCPPRAALDDRDPGPACRGEPAQPAGRVRPLGRRPADAVPARGAPCSCARGAAGGRPAHRHGLSDRRPVGVRLPQPVRRGLPRQVRRSPVHTLRSA